jgi:hypothetical protein
MAAFMLSSPRSRVSRAADPGRARFSLRQCRAGEARLDVLAQGFGLQRADELALLAFREDVAISDAASKARSHLRREMGLTRCQRFDAGRERCRAFKNRKGRFCPPNDGGQNKSLKTFKE